MSEVDSHNQFLLIQTHIDSMNPSQIFGDCHSDAARVIKELTKRNICQSGSILSLTPSSFDSDLPDLVIVVGDSYQTTPIHYVAFMDNAFVIDLGRSRGNRLFLEQEYYSTIQRLQR